MEYEGPETPQEETPQEPPAPPPLDPEAAMALVAQRYGVTPEFLDGSIRLQEENRRFREENQRDRRAIEVERARIEALRDQERQYRPPQMDYNSVDPNVRVLLERQDAFERRWEERERAREMEEKRAFEMNRFARGVESHWENLMRAVPTQQRLDVRMAHEAIMDLWPNANFSELGLTPDQAVQKVARYLGVSNGNGHSGGYVPSPSYNPRDRRAPIVIPSAPTGETQGSAVDYSPQQRPGESREQYEARLKRAVEELGIRGLQDGQRVASS